MTSGPAGVIAPLVTPLDPGGDVSRAGIDRQIGAIRTWVSGLMPCISSGEGWRLTPAQWRTAVDQVIRSADGLPVYAGCQATTWPDMEQRSAWAEEMGAAAVVVSVPALHGHPTEKALLERFVQLRRMTRIPMIYYWESFVSGWNVRAGLGIEICSALEAVAVKDSMRSRELTELLLERLAGRTKILQGWEDMLGPQLPVDGYVGPLSLLSASVGSLFSGHPRWQEIALETERFGVLERDYIHRVKSELHARGLIPSAAEFPGVKGVAWDE